MKWAVSIASATMCSETTASVDFSSAAASPVKIQQALISTAITKGLIIIISSYARARRLAAREYRHLSENLNEFPEREPHPNVEPDYPCGQTNLRKGIWPPMRNHDNVFRNGGGDLQVAIDDTPVVRRTAVDFDLARSGVDVGNPERRRPPGGMGQAGVGCDNKLRWRAASYQACERQTVGKSTPYTVGSSNLLRLGALNNRRHEPSDSASAIMRVALNWPRG